ncbi:ankyrin repeat-containing domain protein [Copromyces sp. CBS 386.78]|nr:ankyrin repeat-containing domain protein [Copromyces sp. CBS 386.78]
MIRQHKNNQPSRQPTTTQVVRRRTRPYHEGIFLPQTTPKSSREWTIRALYANIHPYRIDPSIRLRRAIHVNDHLLVKRILRTHPNLLHNPDHSVCGNANSNLHLAASLGHLAICKILVELGHEEETPALNDDHQTALMLAASAGHTEVVHFLCENDPRSILRQDIHGRDAVMEASLNGHDTVVQILLTWAPGGAPVALAQADLDGNTALHFASGNGNLLVLRTLLAAGADPGRKNVWSWTPGEYSATVQAEVYLKGLVTEVQRRKTAKREAEETQAAPPPLSKKDKMKGAFVRLVGRDVDVGD